MKIRMLLIALMLWAAPALAADVDGKWAGAVTTPNGDFNVMFEFKADGTTLNGSTIGFDGAPVPIKNGKVDGDKISFVVTLAFGDMSFDIAYTGVVTAAEIKLSADVGGMPFEFVVKKS